MIQVQRAANSNRLCCKLARLAKMHGRIDYMEKGAIDFFMHLVYFVYLQSIAHAPPMQAKRGVSNSAEEEKKVTETEEKSPLFFSSLACAIGKVHGSKLTQRDT